MADSNFLPEDYVEKKTQRRTNIISLTLFVVVMTGLADKQTDFSWRRVPSCVDVSEDRPCASDWRTIG